MTKITRLYCITISAILIIALPVFANAQVDTSQLSALLLNKVVVPTIEVGAKCNMESGQQMQFDTRTDILPDGQIRYRVIDHIFTNLAAQYTSYKDGLSFSVVKVEAKKDGLEVQLKTVISNQSAHVKFLLSKDWQSSMTNDAVLKLINRYLSPGDAASLTSNTAASDSGSNSRPPLISLPDFLSWGTHSRDEVAESLQNASGTNSNSASTSGAQGELSACLSLVKQLTNMLAAEPGKNTKSHTYKKLLSDLTIAYGKPSFHEWLQKAPHLGSIPGIWKFEARAFSIYVAGLGNYGESIYSQGDSIQIIIMPRNGSIETNLRPRIIRNYPQWVDEVPGSQVSYSGASISSEQGYNRDFMLPGGVTRLQPLTDDTSYLWQSEMPDGTVTGAQGFSFTDKDWFLEKSIQQSPRISLLGHGSPVDGQPSGAFLTKMGVVLTDYVHVGLQTELVTGLIPDFVPAAPSRDLEVAAGAVRDVDSYRWWDTRDVARMNYRLDRDHPLGIWIGFGGNNLSSTQPIGGLYPKVMSSDQIASMGPYEAEDKQIAEKQRSKHAQAESGELAPFPKELSQMLDFDNAVAKKRGLSRIPLGDYLEYRVKVVSGLPFAQTAHLVRSRDHRNLLALILLDADTRSYEYDYGSHAVRPSQIFTKTISAGYACLVSLSPTITEETLYDVPAYNLTDSLSLADVHDATVTDAAGSHHILPVIGCYQERAKATQQSGGTGPPVEFLEDAGTFHFVDDGIQWLNDHPEILLHALQTGIYRNDSPE